MDDKKSSGGEGRTERMAAELAERAGSMARALAGAMENLSGVSLEGDARRKLGAMGRVFETQRMWALDIASGASERRKRPLVEAMAAAWSGGDEQWVAAMECLAQCALDEARPAWYAGAMLSHLGVDPGLLPARAAWALAGPIAAERSLGAPGYHWDWPRPLSQESQASWLAVAARAGVDW